MATPLAYHSWVGNPGVWHEVHMGWQSRDRTRDMHSRMETLFCDNKRIRAVLSRHGWKLQAPAVGKIIFRRFGFWSVRPKPPGRTRLVGSPCIAYCIRLVGGSSRRPCSCRTDPSVVPACVSRGRGSATPTHEAAGVPLGMSQDGIVTTGCEEATMNHWGPSLWHLRSMPRKPRLIPI